MEIKEELLVEIENATTLPQITSAYNKLMQIVEEIELLESGEEITEEEIEEKNLQIETLKDILMFALENKAEGIIYFLNKYDSEVGKSSATKAEDKGFYYQEEQRIKELRKQETKKRDRFVNFVVNQMNFLGIQPKKDNGIKTLNGILSLREVKEQIYPDVDQLPDTFKKYIIPQITLTYDQFISLPEDIKTLISGRVKEDLDKEKIKKDEVLSSQIREEKKLKLKIY